MRKRYVLWSSLGDEKKILQKQEAFYPDIEIVGCASAFKDVKTLYNAEKANGVILSTILAGRFPGSTISEMLDKLGDEGIKDILLIPVTLLNMPIERIVDENLEKDFMEKPSDFSEPIVIKFLAADGCNLNCAGCSHFSPLIDKPHMLTPDEVVKECRQLKKVFRYVRSIEFLGGEPLINPMISTLLEAARSVFPYSYMSILTNGILIPKLRDDQLRSIKENSTRMVISRYLPTDKMAGDIEETLKRWDIPYLLSEKIEYFRMQYNTKGDKDPIKNFRECPDHLCHTIRNGMLGGCYYATMGNIGNRFFHTSIPYQVALYDIYDTKLTGAELFWRLNKGTGLCAYCNTVMGSPMMPWHVSSKGREEAKEWFYDEPSMQNMDLRTVHCAFYGGGGLSGWVLREWAYRGLKPECIIDKRASGEFSNINGIPVISPSQIGEFDKDMIYVISCNEQESVKEVLNENNVSSDHVFDGRIQEAGYVSNMLSMIKSKL